MRTLLVSLLISCIGQTCLSADFQVEQVSELQYPQYGFPNRLLVIRMDGIVEQGDTEDLVDILDSYAFDPWFEFDKIVLTLNSQGGSFAEALAMMDVLRERNVQTYIDEQATCLSACAMIFMGGTTASVDSQSPSRTLRPGGTLGFHAPSLGISGDVSVPISEMNTAYAAALSTLSEVVTRAEERGLPDTLIVEMLATPPSEMLFVETVGDAMRWGINIEAAGMARPFDDVDIIRACFLDNTYSAGLRPFNFQQRLDQAIQVGVQYRTFTMWDEPRQVGVVMVDEFTQESCGLLLSDGGNAQILYSFGDADSIAQTFESTNWISSLVSQQSALDPDLRLDQVPAKPVFRLVDLRCPYAFTQIDANFDTVCLAPDAL